MLTLRVSHLRLPLRVVQSLNRQMPKMDFSEMDRVLLGVFFFFQIVASTATGSELLTVKMSVCSQEKGPGELRTFSWDVERRVL